MRNKQGKAFKRTAPESDSDQSVDTMTDLITENKRLKKAIAYLKLFSKCRITQSMSRKGRCHDNAVAESFFGTLKNELIYQNSYKTKDDAKSSIF